MSGGSKKKRNINFCGPKDQPNHPFWQGITIEKYEKICEITRLFTKDRSGAHDLAHTVILRLFKYCPVPARIVNFDAFIFAIARNAWIDSQKQQKVISLTELENTSTSEIPVFDSNLANVLARYDLKLITAKMQRYDPKLVQTLILILSGEKLPEIAKRLGEPVRTTRFRYYRWRGQIKALLRGEM
jgi:DNA-directed RNA polymerase specialized sigma24 family protein